MRTHLEQHPNGARDFAHILSYIPIESLESVVSACTEALKAKTVSKDIILNILLRRNDQPEQVKQNTDINKTANIICLQLKHTPKADTSVYDQLLSEVSL